VCLLCHKAVGVCREFKVQGRYDTRHKEKSDMFREKRADLIYNASYNNCSNSEKNSSAISMLEIKHQLHEFYGGHCSCNRLEIFTVQCERSVKKKG
jgi:hypothetical protein